MSRSIHCAKCGAKLTWSYKAAPGGKTLIVIAPHACEGVVEEFTIQEMEALPFCQKLTEGLKKHSPLLNMRDKRKEREELKTTAPDNILKAFAKDDFSHGGEMEG